MSAFSGCSSLSSICIPSSVERLCDQCFEGCRSLATVTFGPASILRWVDPLAFLRCPKLSLSLPPSVNTSCRASLW
jgi:hypothetical protein